MGSPVAQTGKQLASDPNNDPILTGVCSQIQDQSKTAFTPYGCVF
jgi:hypothetical protein